MYRFHQLQYWVFQGIAAGTLLYITFFEVLSQDKLARYKMGGLLGVITVALGFTIMAVMEATAAHSHRDGNL